MVDDWRAAVEDLKDNVRHEIITLTNLARELTSIAFPIAEILEQHIKKVGPPALFSQIPNLPKRQLLRRPPTRLSQYIYIHVHIYHAFLWTRLELSADTGIRPLLRENCQPYTCWIRSSRMWAPRTPYSSERICTRASWTCTPRSIKGPDISWRRCCRPGRSPYPGPSTRLPSSPSTWSSPSRMPSSRPGRRPCRLSRTRCVARCAAEVAGLRRATVPRPRPPMPVSSRSTSRPIRP